MPRNPKCTDCPLHRSSKNVCVWGDGPSDAEVMIIGEAPGEAEARTGKPFMGKSGQLLRDRLARNGLTSVYITNIAKCRPPDNRTPTNDEIKTCRKYLDEEFETIKPRAILTLGAPASKSVLKKAKITSVHGQIVEREDGVITCAIYHPAYALRDPSKLPAFEQDLARFARHLKGHKRSATVEWDVVQRENLDRFISDLRRCTEFSFDCETTSLNWFDLEQQIRTIQLGLLFPDGTDYGWVIVTPAIAGSPFHNQRLFEQIMTIVFDELEGKDACGHNGKFDNLWLFSRLKKKFRLTFDTMLASHTLDENTDHDLKSLVRAHLDEPDYDVEKGVKTGQTEGKTQQLFRYGAYDAVYTLRLKVRVFQPMFRKDITLRRLFYKLVMPAARAFEDIDYHGLWVNLELMHKTEQDVHRRLEAALKELNKMAGRPINWNAPQQVAELLYGDLKLECTIRTPKGAPSTNEEALLEIKGKHPIADKLVEYRELEKFRSTYLDGWKELMVGEMLYLSTKLHGTVTGRYSNRLHQVPRDGTIRNLIGAPDGWVFVQADLSQVELRVIAILARDVELTTCYRRGIDVHWRTLMAMINTGEGDGVELAIKTVEMYCLRHHLPANRASCEILQAVWDQAPYHYETESLLQATWTISETLRKDGRASDLPTLSQAISTSRDISALLLALSADNPSGENSSIAETSTATPGRPIRRRVRGESTRGEEQSVEGRNSARATSPMEEKLLRALWQYTQSRRASQRSRPVKQQKIQLSDALSLLSSFTPQLAQTIDKRWKEWRKRAKSINFGYAFGMRENKFIETAKLKYGFEPTQKEAAQFRSLYFHLYQQLEPWHKKQRRLVHLNGYVRNLAGRMRRLPGIHSSDRSVSSECERQAINSPVQGYVGDHKAMAAVEIHETFNPDTELRIVGEVHDCLLLWIRPHKLDELLPRVAAIMREPRFVREMKINLPVPLEAEFEVGPWGAGKTWRPSHEEKAEA